MQKIKLFLMKQISFGTIGMHTMAILIQHMFQALDEIYRNKTDLKPPRESKRGPVRL
jgi:hypothetical protein